jgi:cytidylate kinase
MKKLAVAIDGPAGAGKSTVAQILARRLGYTYIDTGAMYRALTWQIIQSGIDINDENRIAQMAETTKVRLSFTDGANLVFANEKDVTAAIRERDVNTLVSAVAKIPKVREIMLKAQQDMGASGKVVMDGRDIGTHVLPNAEVKVFLTASITARAKRRYLELKEKNGASCVDLAEIEKEIAKRDEQDSNRASAPLIQAADAVVIDTTALSIEEVVQKIFSLCEEA